jgi:mono/diheme cytochrome c family protein
MAKNSKRKKPYRIVSVKSKAILASLALMLILSACGQAKPYKPQSPDSGSGSKIVEPVTASSSPTSKPEATPAKTTAPSSTPTAQGSAQTTVPSPTASPVTQPSSQTPTPAPASTPAATPSPTPTATPAPKPTPSPSVSPTPAPTEPAKTANADAEALFKSSCIACHGDQLQGKSGPNLQKVGARKTKEQIVTQISKGSTEMPGFEKSLDQASIETLSSWLAGLK